MLGLRNLIPTADKVVGLRQVRRGLASGEVRSVVLARDADAALRAEVESLAMRFSVRVIEFPDMEELGKVCGIDVNCAVVGLTVEAE